MFTLIGLLLGGFAGFVLSGYLGESADGLSGTVRQAIDRGVQGAGNVLAGITRSMPYGSLINIGVVVLLVILVLWMISFGTALVLGILAGIVYKDQAAGLPFVSGLADTIRQKIDSGRGGPPAQ